MFRKSLQKYISPEILEKLKNQDMDQNQAIDIQIDPYKSDIYSMGIIIMELYLIKLNIEATEREKIFEDREKVSNYLKSTNINELLLQQNNFIHISQDQKPYHYQIKNILQMMLQAEVNERASSIKLALVSQQNTLILDKLEYPQFYRQYFPPQIVPNSANTSLQNFKRIVEEREIKLEDMTQSQVTEQQQPQYIEYSFIPMIYEGNINQAQQKEGKGTLWRLNNLNELKQIYTGTWNQDVPVGFGTFFIFQDFWKFVGQFTKGRFSVGKILYKDQIVYEGEFFNYLNFQWMEKKDCSDKFQVDSCYSLYTRNSQNNSQQNQYYDPNIEKQFFLTGNEIQLKIDKPHYKVDEQTFDLFLQITSPVQHLNLHAFTESSIVKLSHLLPNSTTFSNLKSLKISIKSIKDVELLINFFKSSNSAMIEELDFSDSQDLVLDNNELAKTICQNYKKLQNFKILKLNRCQDSVNKFLRQLVSHGDLFSAHLQELYLQDCQLENKTLEQLFHNKQYQKLKKLILKNNFKITSEGLSYLCNSLTNIRQLQYLDLTGMLANVSSIGFFSDSNQEAFKKLINNLPLLKHLETLILDSANVNDIIIEYLARTDVKTLKYLSLKYLPKVTFKGLFYLQVSGLCNGLKHIILDQSGVALPKPSVEKWRKIHLSVLDTKGIDNSNLFEYLKSSKQINELTIYAKILTNEIHNAINISTLQKINFLVQIPQDIHKVFQFLKICTKQDLVCNFQDISIECGYDLQNQIEIYYKNKEIKEIQLENIRFNDITPEVYFEKETITKLNSKQFLNTYLARYPDPPEIIDGSHNKYVQDLYRLLNHKKTGTRNYLDLTQNYISKEALNTLLSSSQIINFEGLNLSNSQLQSKHLLNIAKNKNLVKIRELILKNTSEEALQGVPYIVESQVLKQLKTITYGHTKVNVLLKNLLKTNDVVLLTFGDVEIKWDNFLEISVQYNNNQNLAFFIYVKKGASQQKPPEGEQGILKVKLNNFTSFKISNEENYANIQKAILDILRYKNQMKELPSQQIKNQQNQQSLDGSERSVKILVLGEHLAGKKQLCNRWCHDLYQEQNEQVVMTRYYYKDITTFNNQGQLVPLRINLQTISNQPQFYQMQKFLYQETDGIVVVLDINSPTIKQSMSQFIDEFKTIKYEKNIVFIGNKLDNDKNRKFSTQELIDYAESLEVKYTEVSAKIGTNVDNVFHQMGQKSFKQKSSKPIFNNDQLINLGQIVSTFQVNTLILNFNFLKSRSKLVAKSMETLCQKISTSQGLKNAKVIIKNWYAITDNEKDGFKKIENESLQILLINQNKRPRNMSNINFNMQSMVESSITDSKINELEDKLLVKEDIQEEEINNEQQNEEEKDQNQQQIQEEKENTNKNTVTNNNVEQELQDISN